MKVLECFLKKNEVNYELLCNNVRFQNRVHQNWWFYFAISVNLTSRHPAGELWGVGVLYVGDYSPHGWQVRPLNVPCFLSVRFCASVMILFTLLIWPGMKCSKLHGYRWVSVCGWESERKTVTLWRALVLFLKLHFIDIRWKKVL